MSLTTLPSLRGLVALAALTATLLTGCGGSSESASTTTGTSSSTTSAAPRPADGPDAVDACADIDLVAPGSLPADADAVLTANAERFAAVAAEQPETPTVVCGEPMQHWRDLVVQKLYTDGLPDGALVTDTAPDQVVLRLTRAEWQTYFFRDGEDPDAYNFVGAPRGRMPFGDGQIIRTTKGGLVFERPDTYGVGVVSAVWDYWYEQKGYLEVGWPTSKPYVREGVSGAYQDFTEAWGNVPGQSDPLALEDASVDDFVWHPVAEPAAGLPPNAKGNVLQVTGVSYFVDQDGVRHWIADTDLYACAIEAEEAVEIEVRGYELATFELGDPYRCDLPRSSTG